MMFPKKSRFFTLTLLVSWIGAMAMPLRTSAQLEPQKTRLLPPTALHPALSAPGSGRLTAPLRVLSPSQVHKLQTNFQSRLGSDPMLYTTRYDINKDGFIDLLWGFPTIGYDLLTGPNLARALAHTLQAAAVTPNNTANVMLGQIGAPAQITRIVARFGLFDVTDPNSDPQTGSVGIFVFDGVDLSASSKPSNAKLATDTDGNPAAYIAQFNSATGTSNWAFDFDSNTPTPPIKITDPNGRFGLLIAKVDDAGNPMNSGPNIQVVMPIGYANGPNAAWNIANGDFGTEALVTSGADSSFNQGAFKHTNDNNVQDFPPLNFNFFVRGRNLDGTLPATGRLQGNIRRRGVNPPVLPLGSAQNPESAPGFYAIQSFLAGTTTSVRTDFVYTQPSYDATGALTTNYRIDGYPAGNYDLLISQLPILFFPSGGSPLSDILWDTTRYPFADYLPKVVTNMTVTGGSFDVTGLKFTGTATTVSARLERLADIDDGSGTNTPDGLVEFADLTALAIAYNTMTGDALFNPAADLVGDPTNPMNPQGFPDGLVEFADLTALAIEYNTGSFEQP